MLVLPPELTHRQATACLHMLKQGLRVHRDSTREVDAHALTVKRFYLLHSPQDFIKMDQPLSAKAALENLKVPVALDTYEGGHGWHGPVFQMILKGLQNLGAL